MTVFVEREGNRIQLRAAWAPDVPAKCKRVSGARWSPAQKVWTYPLDWNTCVALRDVWGSELQIGDDLAAWARAAKAADAALRDIADGALMDASDALPRVYEEAPGLAAAVASRPYQVAGAKYIETGRRVLVGDQPGMGKTLETMAAFVQAGVTGPILVFCPQTAIRATWERELKRWLPQDDVFCTIGTKTQRQKTIADFKDSIEMLFPDEKHSRRTWLICNIEMGRLKITDLCPAGLCGVERMTNARDRKMAVALCPNPEQHTELRTADYPQLFEREWSAIVVDESQRALICHSSPRFPRKMSQTRAGMSFLRIKENGFRLALSGTPWRGKAKNFWGTLNWLRPDVYTSYWRWAGQWFDITNNGFGNNVSNEVRSGLEEAFGIDMRAIMIRRTKKECMKDLPPKSYVDVSLPMLSAQAKAYNAMAKNAAAELEGGSIMADGILAEMTRLKQFAGSTCIAKKTPVRWNKQAMRDLVGAAKGELAFDVDGDIFSEKLDVDPTLPSSKFDWLVDFLAQRGIEKEEPFGDAKVVVASQFTGLLNVFAAELRKMGIDCHLLTGQTPAHHRAKLIESFQGDSLGGPRVFLLNTFAGGVSITLDAADDLVLLDRTWIPDNEEQVEDRIHRASRIHNVTIYSLISEGTIEEGIAETNLSRDELQKLLMDGTRGVEYVRRLLEV